ncbi:MAG: hypothetical protein RBS24_05845 [Bacilli bacterium]|nr:hypothetical protein [Bacilli bacterium]
MINTAKGITKGQIHVLFNDRLKTSGASVLPFSFTVTVAAGQTVDLGLSVHTGKTAKVQWDDGRETTVSYSAGDYTSHTNTYAAAGTYNIKIVDADNLKGFQINNPACSVTIVGALPVNLTSVYLYGTSIAWTYSGALPVNLTYLLLSGSSIAWTYTGALPVNLTYVYFFGSSIAWTYSGALPVDVVYVYIYGTATVWTYASQSYRSTLYYFRYTPGTTGKWLSAAVDQVIADLKASGMAGTVNIAGNNEARTSASDQDLIDLRANGATVTVNEY